VREKYLGDSFDIVKRFWADHLGVIAPLFAHPKFVPPEIKPAFENMVGMRVLDSTEVPTQPFGLFLDPHTGIPLPTAAQRTATASHAPLRFIEGEYARLKPKYLICFDQSHHRGLRAGSYGAARAKTRGPADAWPWLVLLRIPRAVLVRGGRLGGSGGVASAVD
jgi:hypothetical protein